LRTVYEYSLIQNKTDYLILCHQAIEIETCCINIDSCQSD